MKTLLVLLELGEKFSGQPFYIVWTIATVVVVDEILEEGSGPGQRLNALVLVGFGPNGFELGGKHYSSL